MKLDPNITYISILRDKDGAVTMHSSKPLSVQYTDYDALEGDKDLLFGVMWLASSGETYKYEYHVDGCAVKAK